MSAMLREPALLKQLKDMAETHAIELRAYEATVANLEQQLETERMRLAACGVIAMANTPETAAQAREMLPEYWSASAKDCADMVDREMELRERIRQLEAERDEAIQELVNIRDATPSEWSDPTDFKAWAQSRAAHTIGRIAADTQQKEGE